MTMMMRATTSGMGNGVRVTRGSPTRTRRMVMGDGSRKGAHRGGRASVMGDDDDAQKVKMNEDDASTSSTSTSKPASYYAGMLTEPVAPGVVDPNERDVVTPTIKLVGRSAVGLTALTLGFLASNGLPPFDK